MVISSARHEGREDLHDHIGSNSPTPSGVETPRPDLHDKRLPGIMSYFGQVGRDPSQNTPSRSSQVSAYPEASQKHAPSSVQPVKVNEKRRLSSSASIGSMVMVEREQTAVPTPPLDGSHHEHVSLENVPETDPSRMPPTPISSAASVVHRDGEVAENGSSMVDGGMASITQALRNFVLPKSAFGMKERRHQSLPVSSVTKSTVTAAHISNPTSSTQSSRPHSPPSSSPSSAKLPSSQTVPETHELTSSVATVPRDKSTPPHTPRALSQEDRRDQTRSPLSSTSTAADNHKVVQPQPEPEPESQPQKQLRTDLPSVSSPRGKLSIKIAEGRNLKPSFDPYVVVQFEWNEYVSKGPRHDKMEVDSDAKGPVASLQSIPIRRTDSDMGKPMAIPMRSRQSSTNGEERPLDKVTDPQWDREANL